MKMICKQGTSLLLFLLCLNACSNSNDKYPNEYVGFDKIKEKSATARIRIYPKMIKNSSEIYLICTPDDKEVKQSQLTLQLVAK